MSRADDAIVVASMSEERLERIEKRLDELIASQSVLRADVAVLRATARRALHERLHPGVPFEGRTCSLCEVHDRFIAAVDAVVRRRMEMPDGY
jgi:hypothetical protein